MQLRNVFALETKRSNHKHRDKENFATYVSSDFFKKMTLGSRRRSKENATEATAA